MPGPRTVVGLQGGGRRYAVYLRNAGARSAAVRVAIGYLLVPVLEYYRYSSTSTRILLTMPVHFVIVNLTRGPPATVTL